MTLLKPRSLVALLPGHSGTGQNNLPHDFSTFIFPIYITSAAFGPEEDTSRALGLAATIAGIAVAIVAPVFGRRSDEAGRRKFWLFINTLLLSG